MPQTRNFSRPAPLVNIAAIAVIVASLVAIGAVTGLIPSAFSRKADSAALEGAASMAASEASVRRGDGRPAVSGASELCRQCGVIESVRQVQLNRKAGMTFASGLRSILRQDPDVILVGEVRDSETAEIAVQAGLTGHRVLTTCLLYTSRCV